MPREQRLKDLQHQWRAEMLQGHKAWKNETADRALQPSALPFITQGPDKGGWDGSRWCFPAENLQAALKYPLPLLRAVHRGRHV